MLVTLVSANHASSNSSQNVIFHFLMSSTSSVNCTLAYDLILFGAEGNLIMHRFIFSIFGNIN